jgi:predicted nucleic acid-binding protein
VPREVFVDAGAWIALSDRGDQHHSVGVETYRRLLSDGWGLVTSNLVVAEAQIVIRRAVGHQSAMRFLQALRQSSRLTRVYSTSSLEEAAESILARYADQDFSLADAVSFALMRQRQIAEAFAFDRHFLTAGFVLVPPRT